MHGLPSCWPHPGFVWSDWLEASGAKLDASHSPVQPLVRALFSQQYHLKSSIGIGFECSEGAINMMPHCALTQARSRQSSEMGARVRNASADSRLMRPGVLLNASMFCSFSGIICSSGFMTQVSNHSCAIRGRRAVQPGHWMFLQSLCHSEERA